MYKLWRIVLVSVVFMSCSSDQQQPPSSPDIQSEQPPGYEQLFTRFFQPTCGISACHSGPSAVAGLAFDEVQGSLDALRDGASFNEQAKKDNLKLVNVGSADDSYLLSKLEWSKESLEAKGYGAKMPVGGFQGAGPKTLAAIRSWINAGAPLEGANFELDSAQLDPTENYVDCAGTTEEQLRACFPVAPNPQTHKRIYTPPLTLQPGTEHIICSRIDIELSEDLLITKAEGYQMTGGHHAAIYVSLAPESDFAPVECDTIDMGAMRFVTGAGGAGGQDLTLPNAIALRISKTQQIIVQSHYINTTLEPQVVMDAVDLTLAPASGEFILADSLAVIDSEFEVPVGATGYERVKTCTIDRELSLYLLLGHTHDFGVLFKTELIRSGEPTQTLYEATDGSALRDNPYIELYDPPLDLKEGDQLRITCQWTNTEDHVLTWPEEMCVAFAYYAPAEGFLICDTQDETPQAIGGEGADGCGAPGDVGNDVGVGLYCTPDGDECKDNGAANFCIANFSDHNYCTIILCSNDEQCGEGAHCASESAGSACVPDYCD